MSCFDQTRRSQHVRLNYDRSGTGSRRSVFSAAQGPRARSVTRGIGAEGGYRQMSNPPSFSSQGLKALTSGTVRVLALDLPVGDPEAEIGYRQSSNFVAVSSPSRLLASRTRPPSQLELSRRRMFRAIRSSRWEHGHYPKLPNGPGLTLRLLILVWRRGRDSNSRYSF